MQRILLFGSTGPTGVLLAREVLNVFEGITLVLYVRSPDKLPEDLKTNTSCIVIEGQLDDIPALSKAMESVDIVLSALGPSQFSQPPGTPLAHAYRRIVNVMKEKGVKRLIALGTISIEDPEDQFNFVYYGMVKTVSITMHNAYKDIRAIGAVIRASQLEHWTIVRVPVLSNSTSKDVKVGYIGGKEIGNRISLNRAGFAAFVVQEIGKKEWDCKAPVLVSV
ncbi:hypothetical protein FB45DRAFT_731091 [Roridomyces roridus]|uniref:NAD(P)-binding domain-containing protein n=1 Tax=Roridomyces roridus TaxID=1738132 RepID=A0AAD7CIW5_9AGAR|nr:hypothetical protein FB45DRAFT_731091 [Roridomyces roridus]